MIHFSRVSYRYPSGTVALRDVSITVEAGRITAVIGANGSGKSTIARLMAGLILPTEGTVEIEGLSTRGADPTAIRSRVALTWQNPDNQLVCGIVEDDIAFGPENLGLARDEISDRIEEIAARLGLGKLRRAPVHNLSSAEKQMVAIAGAMAMQPRFLILDEVTSRLDAYSAQTVLNAVSQWARDHNSAVVMITHQMSEILRADQVIRFEPGSGGGRMVEAGAPQDVLRNAKSSDGEILQSPLYDSILRLEKLGVPIDEAVETVEDLVAALCH